jgi:hypothetical protein
VSEPRGKGKRAGGERPKDAPAEALPSSLDATTQATTTTDAASLARAVTHFRTAGYVVVAFAAALTLFGGATDRAAVFEIGLGIGLIAGLVLLSTFLPVAHSRLAYLHPASFFLATWHELDSESARDRGERAKDRYDYHPLIALSVGAVCLAVMEYFGHTVHFNAYADDWAPSLRSSPYFELMGFAWWSAFRVLGYFVVPALVVVLVFKERIRDHGLETKGFFEHAWIYAISYVVVLVCVILVARHDAHFQTYYPFYGHASRSWGGLLDVGAPLRRAVLLARVLLPWLLAAVDEALARQLRHLRDGRAVLHDPLRKAVPRDDGGDHRGHRARHALDEDALDLERLPHPRQRRHLDGHGGPARDRRPAHADVAVIAAGLSR